ncbi:MAG: type II toxin-antitoxin system PemK/MazF family toxin [Acidithiobacillus sp.]|nr:type II toxin-antitoxin system PemK/MazF family toxin [Acidithiobacillus sp.]
MKRGDLVTVSLPGDYGKPRPAIIIQSNLLSTLDSVLVCPVTTVIVDASAVRITVEPSPTNGLRHLSQIMIDKITALRRDKVGAPFGHLTVRQMTSVNRAILLVVGLVE